jgi:hypothetical protein
MPVCWIFSTLKIPPGLVIQPSQDQSHRHEKKVCTGATANDLDLTLDSRLETGVVYDFMVAPLPI